MFNDNVVKLIQPGILADRLTEVRRDGARALLTQAVEAEVSEFRPRQPIEDAAAVGGSCDTGICPSARS